MDLESAFSAASALALPGWAILILGPRGRPWLDGIPAVAIPVALSGLYAALVLTGLSSATGGGFGSLAEVRALLTPDVMLLAGWVHYLAFDLLVGALLARRMDRVGVPRLVQAPLLLLTFLLGPLGALLAFVTEGAMGLRPARSPARQLAA